jgi:hypothetical protein
MAHLLIESDGILEGTVVKDSASDEPLGLVKSASWRVDRLGNLTYLSVEVDESVKAQKKAAKKIAAEPVVEPEAAPAG